MLKKLTQTLCICGMLLLSACSVPVLPMQHFSQPKAVLPAFGRVDVQVFNDNRPDQQIAYQEVLKSDSMTSEFLQTSQGLGSGTWHYTTDPELNVFLQKVMQQVGKQSGFISHSSTKHYRIEGSIRSLSIQMNQALAEVVVRVRFTGVLRKQNGVMLMIMPIDFSYTQAMTKPIEDKLNPVELSVLLDQALTAATMQMYQSIEANYPASKPQVKTSPSIPLTKEGTK
jgi:hypothetical protein